MNTISLHTIWTLEVVSVLFIHGYFKRSEGTHPTTSILFLLITPAFYVKLLLNHYPFYEAVFAAFSLFYASLLASIVTYRLSPFHPLYKYPGPVLCRISKFWGAWIALKGETHRYTKALHDQYGPIVRTGPNEISIVDKNVIPFVLGSQGMPRGPVWDGRKFGHKDGRNYDSLITLRDLEEHSRLRKPWNKAFSGGPVRGYVEPLVTRVDQLVEILKDICKMSPGGVARIDLAKWISYFTFDFMGDLAFGGCFELMRDGDTLGFIKAMDDGMMLPSISQHIPWILPALMKIPVVAAGMRNFMEFADAQVTRRLNMTPKHKDIFHYMIEATEEVDSSVDPRSLLAQNSLLAIVAGSDTTSSVLSNVFYFLIRNPKYYIRLQAEIDKVFSISGSTVDPEHLMNLGFLNAVINEAMRLQPAVPTSLQRAPQKGSGGRMLGKYMFIPEGVSVVIPPYTLHRDPRYFSPRPNDFWPERWLLNSTAKELSADGQQDGEEIIVVRDAFIPFSVGPANCAGKPLAMMEMRILIAEVMRHFEVTFEQGYDPTQWERELLDRFVMVKGQLRVALRLRKL